MLDHDEGWTTATAVRVNTGIVLNTRYGKQSKEHSERTVLGQRSVQIFVHRQRFSLPEWDRPCGALRL